MKHITLARLIQGLYKYTKCMCITHTFCTARLLYMYWRVSLCLTNSHVLKLSKIIFFCNFRVTIGSGACKIAQTEEVQQFVGRCVEEEVPIQCVKKSSEMKMAKLSQVLLKNSPYFSYLQIWKKTSLAVWCSNIHWKCYKNKTWRLGK